MDPDVRHLLSQGRRDAAFEALVERYQNKIFRLILSMVASAGRAEEVTQDVLLKVWQALPVYDGRASLSTWIYTIARNTALTHLRSESYRRTLPLETAPEPAGRREGVLSGLEVERLLARLPDIQQEVVKLFYLEDRSIQDVAAMLDMPEGSVKSSLHRARKALAVMMEEKP